MTFHAPLIIDIAGTKLTKVDRVRLQNPLVGGLILFSRNWESRAQLNALCSSIKKLRSDLLICVDHEGGRGSDLFQYKGPLWGEIGQIYAPDVFRLCRRRQNRAFGA